MKNIIIQVIILFLASCKSNASEIPNGINDVIKYDIIVVGKFYKDKSGSGYLIHEVLKGCVNRSLTEFIKKTPNLGDRENGSSVLFVITQVPHLQCEKRLIDKRGQVILGRDAESQTVMIQDIRDLLSH